MAKSAPAFLAKKGDTASTTDMVATGKMSPEQASQMKHSADQVLGVNDSKYHSTKG